MQPRGLAALSALAAALLMPTAQAAALVDRTAFNGQVRTYQTYQTETQIAGFAVKDDTYTGVGGLFIEYASTATTGFGSICTGSLIGPSLVLTAAHCLASSAADPVTGVRFFLPSYANDQGGTAGRVVLNATSIAINPSYTGSALSGNDVGVVKLSTVAGPGRDIYGLYTGSGELDNQSYQKVGTGTIGLGATGTFEGAEPTDFDFRKRVGLNQYEFLWGTIINDYFAAGACSTFDVFGAPCDGMLAFDMDSGSAFNDVFGRFMGKPDLGRMLYGVNVDANSSGGDSGGPTFIDGLIAGVTSFGITGNIYEPGDCGPGSVDPSADSTGSCTDSSFGEISVDTRVASSSILSFLDPFLAEQRRLWGDYATVLAEPFIPSRDAVVPTPATLALASLGLAFLGLSRRRSGTTHLR